MQFSTLLLTAVASALTVSAAPAESTKRTCTTVWPTATGNFVLEKKGATIPTQDLDFHIPAGAVGPCTLVLSFPKGKGLDNSGDVRSNVYERLVDQNFKIGSLVGTVDLKGSADQDTFRVINSFACKPVLSYQFRLEGGDGKTAFYQEPGTGIAMTYGC